MSPAFGVVRHSRPESEVTPTVAGASTWRADVLICEPLAEISPKEGEGIPRGGSPVLDRRVPLGAGSTLQNVEHGEGASLGRELQDRPDRPSVGQERVHALNLTSREAVIDMQVETHERLHEPDRLVRHEMDLSTVRVNRMLMDEARIAQ